MDERKIPLAVSVSLVKTNKGASMVKGSNIQFITTTQALILCLCNGVLTLKDIIDLVSKIYKEGRNKVKKDIENFLKTQEKIIIYLPKKLEFPISIRDPKDFAFKPDSSTNVIREYELHGIGIVVNEECLCNCKYCYAIAPYKSENVIDSSYININLAKKFLKEAREMGAVDLKIGGGSVEDYPSLVTLVDFASQKLLFPSIEVSTKPVRAVKKETLGDLRRAGLVNFQVSLDSFSPTILEDITGVKNIFESMLKTIYSAVEVGLKVAVRPTLTKFNIGEISELAHLMHKIGVKYFRVVQMLPFGRATVDFTPERAQLENLEELIPELNSKFPDMEVASNVYRVGTVPSCEGGRLSCFLYPSGDVSLCDIIAPLMKRFNYVLGNIKETSLEKIWCSPSLDPYRTLRCKNEICENCPEKNSCLGGCRLMSYSVFKNPDMPDPLCDRVYEHYEKKGEIFTTWKIKRQRTLQELEQLK